MRRRLIAAAALLLGGCSAGPPQPAPASVVIGLELPLTGPAAADGRAVADAVRHVIAAEWNGRVEGIRVTVTAFDDAPTGVRDPLLGARNLSLLAADPGVLGVVGPLNSDVARQEIPVAAAAHLAVVSPAAPGACLTRNLAGCDGVATELRAGGPAYFFRLAPPDDLEEEAALQYAVDSLHATRFAVSTDSLAYGRASAARFEAALKRRGLTEVVRGDLNPNNEADVGAFLAQAKSGTADAIFMGGREAGGACKVRLQMQAKFDATVPFIGPDGLLGPTCLKDAGAMASGIYTVKPGGLAPDAAGAAAARVLLRAIAAGVKMNGGNLPRRNEVRAAVARSTDPGFNAQGDPTVRVYTVQKSDPAPAWVPGDQVRL
ncbi:MAG: hypothetical protein NVS9B1_10570 [Candidatus Dormibacteraceae bacterium]